MDTEKLKSALPLIKKYAPSILSPKGFKNIGRFMAYQMGYTQGYLIRTGKLKEMEEILKREG